MSTLTSRPRAAVYAAFLDLVGHLQLLRVASSAQYTNNCPWHNSLAKEYRLYAKGILRLTHDH